MKSQLKQSWKLFPSWLRFFLIAVFVLGIVFRFVNIDKKIFWFDEVVTSIRTAGYTEAEVVNHLSGQSILRVNDLLQYQKINPEKSAIDTLKSLAAEDPQHSPLYYLITRVWRQALGSSITVIRSLSVLFSLLIFPAIYWLCLELFASPLVGIVAGVLVAVSPFHLLYAQEARQYSLWSALILLSSALLLRAMRLQTKKNWAIYAISLTLGFYIFFFSVIIAVGHAIYVAVIEKFRLTQTSIAFLCASSLSVIAFFPWLWVILSKQSQLNRVTGWTSVSRSFLELLRSWVGNLGRVFLNTNMDSIDQFIHFLLLLLIAYAIYFICRDSPQRVYLFILTLIGTTALGLILPDLILGGARSTIPRYLTPSYLGIELAVAYLLTTKLTRAFGNNRSLRIWQMGMIALVLGGVLSCAISSTAQIVVSKRLNQENPGVASVINQSPHPLLITNIDVAHLISLGYSLDPKVRILAEVNCSTCNLNPETMNQLSPSNIPSGFSDVFLWVTPSTEDKFIQEVKNISNNQKILVYQNHGSQIWKLND
ncbi:MAG: glycosyltransferase family 39 protein [Cyanobacteriota bacterium]